MSPDAEQSGVEQLPEKWRKRAEKAQELGYTEKAIAVLDCADELEERIDADEDPEIRTDGGQPSTDSDRRNPETGTPEPNYLGNPIGNEYDPTGDELTPQEAVDRIGALKRKAGRDCYLPEYPEVNQRNAGRVRALAQALTLLRRAGFEPDDGEVYLDDDEVMQDV